MMSDDDSNPFSLWARSGGGNYGGGGARRDDPTTSKDAAALVDANALEGRCLDAVVQFPETANHGGGLTTWEIKRVAPSIGYESITPRMVKLEGKGWVYRIPIEGVRNKWLERKPAGRRRGGIIWYPTERALRSKKEAAFPSV